MLHHNPIYRTWLGAAVAALALAACSEDMPEDRRVAGGDPATGRAVFLAQGCGACHTAPGIRGARGVVGPPLGGVAGRAYIAGQIPNEPDAMISWLIDPPAHIPATAMPDTGLSVEDARHLAAFLYTLR